MRVAEPQEVGHREGIRIGEHQERPTRRELVGPTGDRNTVFGLDRVERDTRDPSGAEAGRKDRKARRVLHFDGAAGDTDRGAPDEHVGLEQLAQSAGDVFERSHVVGRRKAHDQVRAFSVELFDDLAGDLAHSFECQGVKRQRSRVAVHQIHATADSTRITPELRAITEGAMP